MKFEIKPPFIFNPWKHHRTFVRERIRFYIAGSEESIPRLKKELKLIGKSQTDFYYGNLNMLKIFREISIFLVKNEKLKREQYIEWIKAEKLQYKKIDLSDGSKWILRIGSEDEKYVHFHPGRYSVFTVRIKASTLKTAVATAIWSGIYNAASNDIRTVNESRQSLLSLPPVKNFSVNKSIEKIIRLLTE